MITLTQPPKLPGKGLAVSAAVHIAAAILLAYFGGTLLAPPVHRKGATLVFIPAPAPEVLEPAPLPQPKLRAFYLPKLPMPEPVQLAAKPRLIEAPVIQATLAPALKSVPAIHTPPPPPQIGAGVLDSPQQAAAPQARPASAVQTGAFAGSTQRLPEQASRIRTQPAGFDTNANTRNEPKRNPVLTANIAGFEDGPARQTQRQPKRAASTGGFGDPTTVANSSQPARTEVIAAGGFGAASAGVGGPARAQQQTARAGFGDTVMVKAQAPSRRPAVQQASASTPIEITFKPRPAYTEEARLRQIEGEVVIEAVFTASGEIQIVRIIRGLGHGLDESALAAVRSIRFRPASRHGQPVDSAATVRMSFELAY